MTRELAPVDAAAPDVMRTLAEKLRECMGKAGYVVLRDLALAANLAPSTVSDALSGGRTPTWKTVSALLKASGVPPNQSWAGLHEAARAAEKQWRQAAHPVETPGDPRSVPGMFSIRPPIGDLPARVRGRDELLNLLGGLLAAPRPALQVLHGLGGCGKTTIALEFARHAQESGHAVFWVLAHQRDRIATAMREIAREIGVSAEQVEETWSGRGSASDLLWRHLDAAVRSWLLVIDNADEPGLLAAAGGGPGDGAGWVRPSAAGVTVITTRVSSPEVWGSQAERHQIGVLDAEDAADVLIDLAGHAGNRGEARALADRLGGLPLALVSAGTYLGRTARGGGLLRRTGGRSARITTFDAYQRALGDLGTDLLDQGLNQPVDTERLERLHRRLVGRTWEMSLDLLEAQGISHVRGLMRLMSCFASSALPVDLINVNALAASGALPESSVLDEVDRALEALVNLNLLDVTESDELTTVPDGVTDPPLTCLIGHRLVLEATAARLHALPLAERDAVWRAAADLVKVAAGLVPEEARNWDWWRLVAPHIQVAVAVVPDHDEGTLVRVLDCGLRCFSYLVFSKRFEDASAFADMLFDRAAVLDSDHPVRLATRHRRIFMGTASYAEDEIEYCEILDRQTRVLGPDHQDTLITDHQWAATLIHTRGPAEAEPEIRRVAQKRSRLFGPADPYTLISRDDWADLLVTLGRDAEAEAERRVMVEDCRRDRGEFDHYTLLQRAHLATLMNQRGHSDEAQAEFRYLTEHCGTGEPMDSSHLPTFTRHQMAHILDKAGRFADAEVEYRAVLADPHSAHRDDYRHLSRWLGRNLRSQSRRDESVAHFADLIASCDDLAVDDPFVLSLRHEYAEGLGKVGRHAEAESEMSAVLDIRARTVGADDSVALQERHCRAHALEKLGRTVDAEVELREVAATFRNLMGAEDKRARRATWCHAMTLFKNDQLSDALPEFETCLAAELGALGGDHRDVLMTRRRIAEVRFRLKVSTRDETVAEFDAILPRLIEHDGENGPAVKAMRTFLTELGHSNLQGY